MERQEILSENMQQGNQVTMLIKEETIERRHSIRSIQKMGNAFKIEDEEEIFNNVYLGTTRMLQIQIHLFYMRKVPKECLHFS